MVWLLKTRVVVALFIKVLLFMKQFKLESKRKRRTDSNHIETMLIQRKQK